MKRLYSLLLVLVLSICLLGCSSHQEYGKYLLSSMEINNNVYVEGDEEWETILGMNISGDNIYIELKDDSQMIYAITTNVKKGTWKNEGSMIIMTIDGFEEKAELVEDMLVLVNSDNVKLVFKK